MLPSSANRWIIFLVIVNLLVSIDQSLALDSGNERLSDSYPSNRHLLFQPSNPSSTSGLDDSDQKAFKNNGNRQLVPIQLGVMSKCPDAQVCEDVFDKVLPQVKHQVDLSLVYMGDIDPSTPFGARCRHGDSECKANVQQLCYKERFPGLRDWWGFVQCQNYAGMARLGEESLAKTCAKVNKHDWDKDVKDCADGRQGRKLLQSSVALANHLGVEKSCSIFINHKLVCIRDGTWKNCQTGHEVSDFVKYIQNQYKAINPPK